MQCALNRVLTWEEGSDGSVSDEGTGAQTEGGQGGEEPGRGGRGGGRGGGGGRDEEGKEVEKEGSTNSEKKRRGKKEQ